MSDKKETSGIGEGLAMMIASPVAFAWWGLSVIAGEDDADQQADAIWEAAGKIGDHIEREHGADIKSAVVQVIISSTLGAVIDAGNSHSPDSKN